MISTCLHLVHVHETSACSLPEPDAVPGGLGAARGSKVKMLGRELGQERSFGPVVGVS